MCSVYNPYDLLYIGVLRTLTNEIGTFCGRRLWKPLQITVVMYEM